MDLDVREPLMAYGKNKFTIEEYLEYENASREKHELLPTCSACWPIVCGVQSGGHMVVICVSTYQKIPYSLTLI